MAASILIDRLTKYYGNEKIAALDQLSLAVQPGEIYGFLGANGAGKSTAIRLLMNFLQPSSGSATILGLDVVDQSIASRQHIGYLPGDVALHSKPTGRELLDFLSDLQGATAYRQTLEKRFQADLHKPIGTLSKGNRQKIGIIQAFMHEPTVLILDEPTSGLDPLMQEAFYQTVLESKQRGAAILMSSHNLAEAQRICDRIGIIKHGQLILEQSMGQENTLGAIIFKVVFASPTALIQSQTAKGLKLVTQINDHTALFKPTTTIAAALAALGQYDITELSTQQVDLEDEFLEFYGDSV